MFETLPRKKSAAATQWKKSPQRAELVRRLWQAADGQVKQLERRLAATLAPAERERDARTMAVLVKTLRELTALDAARRQARPQDERTTSARRGRKPR